MSGRKLLKNLLSKKMISVVLIGAIVFFMINPLMICRAASNTRTLKNLSICHREDPIGGRGDLIMSDRDCFAIARNDIKKDVSKSSFKIAQTKPTVENIKAEGTKMKPEGKKGVIAELKEAMGPFGLIPGISDMFASMAAAIIFGFIDLVQKYIPSLLESLDKTL